MYNDLRVHGGLEKGSMCRQPIAEDMGIDKVSVVGYGQPSPSIMGREGLGVIQITRPGRRVSHMAYSTPSWKRLQDIFRKDLGDQSHVAVGMKGLGIGGNDPRAFLPPVLQGVEAQIG